MAMVLGFVLIKAGTRKEKDIKKELQTIEQIQEVHSVFGEYDMIVKLSVDNYDDLSTVVIDRIREIEGVKYTKTLPVSDGKH